MKREKLFNVCYILLAVGFLLWAIASAAGRIYDTKQMEALQDFLTVVLLVFGGICLLLDGKRFLHDEVLKQQNSRLHRRVMRIMGAGALILLGSILIRCTAESILSSASLQIIF